jgi:hypothetical protein
MARITFAAAVLFDAGQTKPAGLVPERVPSPKAAIVVRNPYTGFPLVLRASDVVNVVGGVASVLLEASYSGRLKKITRGKREFINPLTGNTFLVSTKAIIKENA